MGDFWQHGGITTIHRLPGAGVDELDGMAARWAADRPAALIIPALASEMDGPAWAGIMGELGRTRCITRIVLALGGAGTGDMARARCFMDRLHVRADVVWPEGPAVARVLEGPGAVLGPGSPGKGRDVWVALGYLLGLGGFHAAALHDADIVTYTREIPLRLLAPLLHPGLDYAFCKGYYARVSGGELAGRVTRLLVAPLLSALGRESQTPALGLIGAMRYPLAGEFALTLELARVLPVPRDWGLEIGILTAVAGAVPAARVCQADLCDNYDHKHQNLSPDDATRGLNRMAAEVAASLLKGAGRIPSDLPGRYVEAALDLIPAYRADALANGLAYDEAAERRAVEVFASSVARAAAVGEDTPTDPLPPWEEVRRRVPGLMESLVEAVRRDNP